MKFVALWTLFGLSALLLLHPASSQQQLLCCSDSDCRSGYKCINPCCGCDPMDSYGLCSKIVSLPNCCDDGDCPDGQKCPDYACCTCFPATPAICQKETVVCFSAQASVNVLGKGQVSMKDLSIGDLVAVAPNKYEPIYAFGHWNPTKPADFVKIETSLQPGQQPLELTPDHLIQVGRRKGRFLKADSVQVGAILADMNGLPIKVEKVQTITRFDGVYAPLTPSGTLVVDGILASSYISLQPSGNQYPVFANGMVLPISQQFGIHMALSPFRMLCLGVSSTFCDIRTEDGIVFWADWGMKLAAFADQQTLMIQILLLVLALALITPLYAVEYLVGPKYAPLAILVALLVLFENKKRTLGKVIGKVGKKEKGV